MRMTEMEFEGQRPVDGYGPGGFRVGGDWHDGSLLLLPSGMEPLAGSLSVEALRPVLDADDPVDVLLIGMGPEIAPLPRPVRAALDEAGIGAEVMSTPAACRTYNVLLVEARRVAAALVAL
ncbi:MAG TPA: Mth938-like domain-containing protein [Paracoccaceae bacterium]|nr:Mth938-like domain-containing protein [Paracoccaceae bacterium]